MIRFLSRASVRARLVALLVVAAVPVAAMAAIVAWQNYRMAAGRAVLTVLLAQQALVTQYGTVTAGLEDMLGALSKAPSLDAASPIGAVACDRLLGGAASLRASAEAQLAMVDAGGRSRCAAGAPAPDPAFVVGSDLSGTRWFRAVVAARRFTVVPEDEPGRAPRLDASYPLFDGSRFTGALLASLRLDRIAAGQPGADGERTVWLLDAAGTPLDLDHAGAAALPPAAALARLLAGQAVLQTLSAGRRPYAYAIASLPGGLRLLVGHASDRELRRARIVLLDRLGELGLLLLCGFAAIAMGANVAVLEPLRRLNHAVGRWRGGGPFDPGRLAGVPREVRELSLSFAQATQALTDRERQLRGALAQQDLLMQEIHHRVKNNLQVIASLLNLQAARIRQPEARAEFQSARDRIRALATVHRHLYAHAELHTINMRSFLKELCGQLFQALGETTGARIELEIEAPELQLSSDQAVPLALIVTETVSNAVKYAFPAGRPGHISVRLSAEGEEATLTIQDDGVGIPSGRGESEAGARDGIGIQLVRGFARQLGASLTVTESNGTRYVVALRLRRERDAAQPPAPAHADAAA